MRTLLLTGLLFLSSACQSTDHHDQHLHQIFQNHWEWLMNEYPEWSTYEGLQENNHRLTDRSLEAIERRHQVLKERKASLLELPLDQLTRQNQEYYQIFLSELEQEIEGQQFPSHYLVLNQMGGPHSQFPRLIRQMPNQTEEDYQNLIARLKAFPTLLKQSTALMQKGLESGVTPPQITLREIPNQLQSLLEQDEQKNPLLQSALEFSKQAAQEIQQQRASEIRALFESELLPALSAFAQFVRDDYLPRARKETAWSTLPEGQAWYEYLIRSHTTTDLSAKQIHQIGLDEVARIQAEMKELARESGFKDDFAGYKKWLLTDKQFYYQTPEELVLAYQAMCKRIDAEMPKLFELLPRTPYGVKEMEPHTAASSPAALYYSGSMKARRSGTFYVNTTNLSDRPKWEMMALSLHEAVPGHHLQIALAQEQENVPEFRKRGRYTAYVEGWGLYAESLGKDLELYETGAEHFGRLSFEMWRAVRLVVDTGLHALGWSREEAIAYFIEKTGRPASEAVIEVDRYIVRPGQALAYKLGELKIHELRGLASKELGERFDLRKFHRVILEQGAMPLSLLEKKVKEWIDEEKRS